MLTAVFLLVASAIFLAQTILQVLRKEQGIFQSFNLLMTVFMLTWSVTEFFEDTLQPPFSMAWHYAHFVVMVSFAVAITWRWGWTARKMSIESKNSRPIPNDIARGE